MLRDFRRASRTTRRLAAPIAMIVAAAIAGCGIKGPLKRPDAAPAPSAAAPAAGADESPQKAR
jgi:predicted small lipoprotein YifL